MSQSTLEPIVATANGVTIYHDILFKDHVRYPKWLDVYQPEDTSSIKGAILYVHGGAFVMGSRRVSATPAFQLAKQGYVVVAPDYSLTDISEQHLTSIVLIIIMAMLFVALMAQTVAQVLFILFLLACMVFFFTSIWLYCPSVQVTHPDHIRDVARAYRWMVDHAAEYKMDPQVMFVMGHSAGGHLASLLATNVAYLDEAGVESKYYPKAAVSLSGLYSDMRLKQTNIGRQILHNTFGYRPSYYDCFPIYHVSPKTCPFLLLNAGYDISLKQHSLDFFYTLRANAVYTEIEYFDLTSHFDIAKKWDGANRNVFECITSFLQQAVEYANQQKL